MIDTDRLRPMLRSLRVFGRLVHQGLSSRAEVLAALKAAAEAAEVRGAPHGWQVELAIGLNWATAQADREACRAGWDVRDAIVPLLVPGMPSASILAAAKAAAGDALHPAELLGVVEREMLRALRRPWRHPARGAA